MAQKQTSSISGSEVYNAVQYTLSLLFMLTMIFAVVGAYFAHMGLFGATFGTPEGSLSILAVVLILMNWTRYADPARTDSVRYHGTLLILLVAACIVATIDFVSAHLTIIPMTTSGGISGSTFAINFPGSMQSSLSLLAFAFAAKHMVKHIGWMFANL